MRGVYIGLCLSLILTIGLTAVAQAQERQPPADDEFYFLMAMVPAAGICHAENTQTVGLKDLLAQARQYDKQCITVRGFTGFRSLFLSLRDARKKGSSSRASLDGKRVGLSVLPSNVTVWEAIERGNEVSVTGMLWFCEDYEGWLVGYCHYTSGPFIGVVSAERVTPKP